MLLKDFPQGFSLGYSVHVLGILMQSILMRVSHLIEEGQSVMNAEEAAAIESLRALLEAAHRDIETLTSRRLN